MIWFGLLLIGVLALLPLAWGVWAARRAVPSAALTDDRSSALALYRGQLAEVARDRAAGLLGAEEYESARIEVQRRLLAADRLETDSLRGGSRRRAILTIAIIPLAALGLYLVNGHPLLPPQRPHHDTAVLDPKMAAILEKLRRSVSTLHPGDQGYAQGHVLLGQVEEARGRTDAALRDYRMALDAEFAPELALRIAEMQRARDGHISADSLALYRRALDAAPPDAPWRVEVEARVAAGEHDTSR